MTARLTVDLGALAANYQWLAGLSGQAVCAAAVKANAYGLGLGPVVARLWDSGCRTFFVASVPEAADVLRLLPQAKVYVLSNFLQENLAALADIGATPVLASPETAAEWAHMAPRKPCALMIDTGINRSGLAPEQLQDIPKGALNIELLLTHLASADEPQNLQNHLQLELFKTVRGHFNGVPASVANSAGIFLGTDYHFDMTRPGLALYGAEAGPLGVAVKPVVHVEAQVLQCRTIPAGTKIGYNGTHTSSRCGRIATLGIGYADGYGRDFSNRGTVVLQGVRCPVVGRVSMDMTIIDVTESPSCKVGDWASLIGGGISLAEATATSGISPYEILTRLGGRFERRYIG